MAGAERTCGYCISRHGLIYRIEELEGQSAHPRCRCTISPVRKPLDENGNPIDNPNGADAADQLDDGFWTRSR